MHESTPGHHANSLSIAAGDDGKILVNCHAGCDPREVVYAFGLTWTDCFPKKDEPKSRITATYDYLDEDGILRFQVCRLEPGADGRAKDFRQRQPDGKGGWTWKTKGLVKFPYRLSELRASDGPVVIVEGEKQVDFLRSLGLTATCNPGGAGKWLKSYAKHFSDRDVVVVPDCDPPNEKTGRIVGAEHAETVANSLIGVAKSIHVIELPDCQPKWGLDDWIQKGGHTLSEFGKICSSAEQWGPESSLITRVVTDEQAMDPLEYDRKILQEVGITYVAQNEESGSIEIFSEFTQKFSEIRDISRMKYEHLVLMCGLIARQKVRKAEGDTGEYSLSEIRVAISTLASQQSAADEKVGIGIWESNNCLIAVTSRRLGLLNGKPEIQITANPVQFGTAYDIGDRLNWIDLDQLSTDVASVKAANGQLYVDEIERLVSMLGHWTYLPSANCFPEVITGMVLATFVQTLWEWRPQIFLTGQASAGKSTMLKMIAHIFGPICKTSSNSSAAGLRQYLGTSGRIVMCDELEKSRHRPDILEMIRASGRGDDSFRGTAGHKHKQFRLQHIFWCASIESGLRSEADQSRFIVAEIRRISGLEMPTINELNEMGKKLLSAAICAYRAARRLIPVLIANRNKDTHPRIAESYAVPVAMYASAIGLDDAEAIQLYQKSLSSILGGETVESDSDSLLQDIMTAKVRLVRGERAVLDVLSEIYMDTGSEEVLASVGIRVTRESIYLNHRAVAKHLLCRTDWEGKRIDTVLMRLPGAERVQKRFGNSGGMRFISIPRAAVSSIDFTDEPSFEDRARSEGKDLFDIS